MNREQAIEFAREAAGQRGVAWSEDIRADRFRFWPFQRFWRVIARRVGVDSFHKQRTVFIVRERTGRVTVHPLRPWGDYSITRLVGAYLGMAVMVVCICLLLQMLLGTERPSWDSSLAVIGTLFLILRMLGKDRWLLRSRPRKGGDVSGVGVGHDQPCHPELVEEPRLRETAPGRMRAGATDIPWKVHLSRLLADWRIKVPAWKTALCRTVLGVLRLRAQSGAPLRMTPGMWGKKTSNVER